MKFYFSPTSEGEIGFQPPNGTTQYDYRVDYGHNGTDDVVLHDTLGRWVPLHISALHNLMEVLAYVSRQQTRIAAVAELQNPDHTQEVI